MTSVLHIIPRLHKAAGNLARHPLGRQVGWVTGPFVLRQILRLGLNIVLAWLLAPEFFGLMLLVNTLQTGTELLTDLGIGQSVVRSSRAEDRRFLNTAWTLQVIRGVFLSVIALALAGPMGHLYGGPELTAILLVIGPTFLVSGLRSTGLFLMQRNMQLQARTVYDLGTAVFHAVVTIALAIAMPTVWALVWGQVIGTVFSTAMSFLVGPRIRPKLVLERAAAYEIVHFGKWIFLSTAIYFAATSTDRFFFVAALPLAMAGIFGIARSISELFGQLANTAGNYLIFPKLAALADKRSEHSASLRKRRFQILLLVAAAMAGALAVSDQFILLVYDSRYHLAAFILPLLMTGTWFGVLATFGNSMLMGCGRPAPGAWSNAAKFVTMLVLLPLAMAHGTLFEALLVLTVAEVIRWLVLAPWLRQEGLATIGDDLALTALFLVLAVAAKLTLGWIGLTPTPAEWWALGEIARG